MSELPKEWISAGIEDLLLRHENGNALKQGWSPRCKNHPSSSEKTWGVLKTTAIQDGYYLEEYNKELPDNLQPRPDIEVKVGDILLTCAGPRIRCGITCLVRRTRKKLMTSGKMYRFRGNPNLILPLYLEGFLRSNETKKLIDEMKTGISDSGLNLTHGRFKTLQVPIPCLSQQHRIVSKIEELFTKLDAGVECLKKAKKLLKQYRQSVLKAAFEGKLTEEWRKEQLKDPNSPINKEPASVLLEKIKKERRMKWEESELAKMKVKGKMPKDNKWKEKYKGIPEPVLEEIAKTPSSWEWVTWESILNLEEGSFKRGPFGSALKKSFFVEKGIKVYEQYCPINDDSSYARYFITEEKYRELEGFTVKPLDFLISCSGVTLGRITQVPKDGELGIINQALLRVRLNSNLMSDNYFKDLFRSPYFQKKIFDNSTGSAIPNVKGVKDLKAILIPLPSIREQQQILKVLDEKVTVIDKLDEHLKREIRRADTQKQSILKSAFSGKLVPQDPNDEPASVLLERIKAEKEKLINKNKTKRS